MAHEYDDADSEEEILDVGSAEGKVTAKKVKALEEDIISSPTRHEGMLDRRSIITPKEDSIELFSKQYEGKPATLQAWLEAENLAYKLYADRHLYGDNWKEQSPICVRTFRENGEDFDDISYQVKRVQTPEGLNAFILTPIGPIPEGAIPEVKVIFAGTKDKPGIVRDFEGKAAGHDSFKQYKTDLMEELNTAVASVPGDSVKISVIGHSLGGADAQRMALKITQAVALPAKPEDSTQNLSEQDYYVGQSMLAGALSPKADAAKAYCPYSALKEKDITLHLVTSAAARITEDQCEKFAQSLTTATTCKNNGHQPLKFETTVFCLDKDIVTRCGEKHLLTQEAFKDSSSGQEYPSVLSMTKATVVSIKSSLFGHFLNFYHDPKPPKLYGIEVIESKPSENIQEKEQKVKSILGKEGVGDSAFSKAIKAAIRSLTIKLGWGEMLNVDRGSAPEVPRPSVAPAA